MRDEVIRLRLRARTKERIREMAAGRGMSMSELMRLAAQGAALGSVDLIEAIVGNLIALRGDFDVVARSGDTADIAKLRQKLDATLHLLTGAK